MKNKRRTEFQKQAVEASAPIHFSVAGAKVRTIMTLKQIRFSILMALSLRDSTLTEATGSDWSVASDLTTKRPERCHEGVNLVVDC